MASFLSLSLSSFCLVGFGFAFVGKRSQFQLQAKNISFATVQYLFLC